MGDYRNPSHNVYALMVRSGRSGSGEFYKPSTDESVRLRSGNSTLYGTPGDRAYLVGDKLTPGKGMTITETTGTGKNKKTVKASFNYELIALTEEGEKSDYKVWKKKEGWQRAVHDPEKAKLFPDDAERTLLRIHPDGPPDGSAGCLVTPTVAEANQLEGMITSNGTVMSVKYFNTQAELDAYKKQLKDAYKKKDTASNGGPPSETKQSEVLENGERSVRAGGDQRPVGYANGACVHSGGVPVRDGSEVVKVGPDQLPLSRETDLCKDNHEIQKTQ